MTHNILNGLRSVLHFWCSLVLYVTLFFLAFYTEYPLVWCLVFTGLAFLDGVLLEGGHK